MPNLKARFIARYGYGAYRNALHPTRDHIIPAEEFDLMYAEIDRVNAAEQIYAAHATALGRAIARAERASDVRTLMRPLVDRAFPTISRGSEDESDGW